MPKIVSHINADIQAQAEHEWWLSWSWLWLCVGLSEAAFAADDVVESYVLVARLNEVMAHWLRHGRTEALRGHLLWRCRPPDPPWLANGRRMWW